MPIFAVEVRAFLEAVSSISIAPEDAADYPWHISLLCGSCGEKSEKPVVVSASDEVEGIRGSKVNLKISCKLCQRVSDLTILPGVSCYTEEDSPEWKTFLMIEARGTEPTHVALAENVPLCVKGNEMFEPDDAIIVDGEYYGYDENLDLEMIITEWRMRVVKAAKS